MFPLVQGKRLPEVYHLGFSGTHFQIFLPLVYWLKFVNLIGVQSRNASHYGQEYAPPSIFGGSFGWYRCARVSKGLGGFVCVEVPAFVGDENNTMEPVTQMRDLGSTLANIFFILNHLLYEEDERNVEMEQESYSQLFVVETFVAREPGQFHGAGLSFSLSPLARKYLEGLGSHIELKMATEVMKEHFFMPHVDTVSEQLNLLVGIASVWQMVRDGLRTQTL